MSENQKCQCPLCNSIYIPADGVTADEFIANNIIAVVAEIQSKTGEDNDITKICMRCGYASMLSGVLRNALSRHFDIYICSECGNDEAIRIFKKNVLPASEWWIVKQIYSLKDYNSGNDKENL